MFGTADLVQGPNSDGGCDDVLGFRGDAHVQFVGLDRRGGLLGLTTTVADLVDGCWGPSSPRRIELHESAALSVWPDAVGRSRGELSTTIHNSSTAAGSR